MSNLELEIEDLSLFFQVTKDVDLASLQTKLSTIFEHAANEQLRNIGLQIYSNVLFEYDDKKVKTYLYSHDGYLEIVARIRPDFWINFEMAILALLALVIADCVLADNHVHAGQTVMLTPTFFSRYSQNLLADLQSRILSDV